MAGRKGIVFVQPHAFYKMERRVEVLKKFERTHIIHYNSFEDAYRQCTNANIQPQYQTIAIFEEQ